MSPKNRVAAKFVSMVDRVRDEPVQMTVVPAFTAITRVDTPKPKVVDFIREKDRVVEPFWRATMLDLVGLDCD